ncbi:hypothetical protein BKA80DRAFT_106614, partial [Phyllosticta citrichinensis]
SVFHHHSLHRSGSSSTWWLCRSGRSLEQGQHDSKLSNHSNSLRRRIKTEREVKEQGKALSNVLSEANSTDQHPESSKRLKQKRVPDDRSLSIPTASTPSSRAVSPSHRRLCDAVWCCVCSASQTVSTRSTTHSTSKGHCRNGNSPREKHDVYEPRRLPPPRPLVPKRSNAATLPRQPCDCPAKAPAVAAPPTAAAEAPGMADVLADRVA